MSSRDSFWFLAGALVTVAILVIARAWFRQRPARVAPATLGSLAVPIAAALTLIGVAFGIYFLVGSRGSIDAGPNMTVAAVSPKQAQQPAQSAGSLDDVTGKLAARLQANGGSDGEWKLLAQSYDYMGRTAEAQAARSHLVERESSGSGDARTSASTGPAAREQMAVIADALDKPGAPRGAANPGAAAQLPAGTGSQSVLISGSVDITPALAAQARPGAILFVYAKQPNAPGPPLAVVRLKVARWPARFTLSDANAMVPGRSLSNANNLQVEARVSLNGDALPRAGDLVGSVTGVNPRDAQLVRISIDHPIG